ncbi:MAG: flagellar basal body L-ring protein FlgH [Burkholderiales bacterium]|nr:flagellar basal body L-ring protein FlgH [Burkholderiales bacterium]
MSPRAALAAVACACALAGCALPPPPAIIHQPVTARPAPRAVPESPSGAIFQGASSYRPLFEDVRARNVGDTLVIQIVEKTAANKKGSSQVNRTADAKAEVGAMNVIPFGSFSGLAGSGSSSNTFEGGGQAAASNDFTGALAVTVIEVLANGNLLVSGEKQIAMTQGTEYIRFSGVVHPRTITAVNTVLSTQVADARIEYKANGYIDSAQVMGWLARFFLTFLPF